MLIALFTLIGVSFITDFLFTRQILPQWMDVYKCFPNVGQEEEIKESYKLNDGMAVTSHHDIPNGNEIRHRDIRDTKDADLTDADTSWKTIDFRL